MDLDDSSASGFGIEEGEEGEDSEEREKDVNGKGEIGRKAKDGRSELTTLYNVAQ